MEVTGRGCSAAGPVVLVVCYTRGDRKEKEEDKMGSSGVVCALDVQFCVWCVLCPVCVRAVLCVVWYGVG